MPHTVVVTFYSRSGATERLATAAAVGAVQARAGIRMRRLPDADPGAVIANHPAAADDLRRMHLEYVGPRDADILAADALVIGLASDVGPEAPECAPFVDMLRKLHGDGKLAGKVAAVVHGDERGALATLLGDVGFTVVRPDASVADPLARAVDLGRKVVAAAKPLA